MEADDSKEVDDVTSLQEVGGSGSDASQLRAATPDLKEVITEESSNRQHRDAPHEKSELSQPSKQEGEVDCFDATQYAFFGGNLSTEVELGGLDDEDDGAYDPPDDEEDGGTEALEGGLPPPPPAFGNPSSSSAVDELAANFKRLGGDVWGPPSQQEEARSDSASGRDSVASSGPSLSPWLPSGDPWRQSPSPAAAGGGEGPWGTSLSTQQQQHLQQQQQQQQEQHQQLQQQQLQQQQLHQQQFEQYEQQQSLGGDHGVDNYHLAYAKQQAAQGGASSAHHGNAQLQQQEQQQQFWEEAQMRPDVQQAMWQQQEVEQLKLQQQQQQLRAGVALSSGPQRAAREFELQELEASLLLQQTNRGEALDRQMAARMGAMGAFGAGVYPPANPYMGPQGHWPPVAGAMPGNNLQNAFLHAAAQTQNRASYMHRGGSQRGYPNQMEESLEAQQRFEMQRNANAHAARYNAGRQQAMRSKYMTAEEVDNIARLQYAATHTTEPYYEDYYHQAAQAKQSAGMGTAHGRRHFAPSHLRDPSHHARSAQPHSFVPVEGLGRLPISSIRRPRPLLEVPLDQPQRGDGSHMRLDQEPMLAARMVVEDGNSLLLDVEDIDRMLMSAQQHSPEAEQALHHRRQLLLEEVASSLQLGDPMVPGSGMQHLHQASGRRPPAGSPTSDIVFLRLVSMAKGRKLLCCFLRMLIPGSELQRLVVMAVFRHMRFLFGNDQQTDMGSLAQSVCTALGGLSLNGLTLCLSAVAVSAEQPPLQSAPGGAGDGAMVLRALLDRATVARTDPGCLPQQHGSWQAAFDAFFQRLSKVLMFDTILERLPLPAMLANSVSKEMPLELLRAALPHTSVAQREQVGQLLQGLLRPTQT